jgi:hypothetical protein
MAIVMAFSREFVPNPLPTQMARFLLETVAMTTRNVKRSAFYHLLNTITPCDHKHKAELDVVGAVVIVGLMLAIVIVAAMLV